MLYEQDDKRTKRYLAEFSMLNDLDHRETNWIFADVGTMEAYVRVNLKFD